MLLLCLLAYIVVESTSAVSSSERDRNINMVQVNDIEDLKAQVLVESCSVRGKCLNTALLPWFHESISRRT